MSCSYFVSFSFFLLHRCFFSTFFFKRGEVRLDVNLWTAVSCEVRRRRLPLPLVLPSFSSTVDTAFPCASVFVERAVAVGLLLPTTLCRPRLGGTEASKLVQLSPRSEPESAVRTSASASLIGKFHTLSLVFSCLIKVGPNERAERTQRMR